MKEIQVFDVATKQVNKEMVAFPELNKPINKDLVTQAVIRTQNNLRDGNACAKTRAEVSFSTRKPFRQKGTGNARAGMKKSPIWRKGGVIFPPRPRDFSTDMNKKQKKLAFQNALHIRLQDEKLYILKNLNVITHKTKEVLSQLDHDLFRNHKSLLIYDEKNGALAVNLNNVPNIEAIDWNTVCTYDIIRASQVFITEEAFQALEKRMQNG
jgi:large subunit ribosomal protein L4